MDVIEEETGEKISYDDMRPHYAEWLRHDEREQKRGEIVRRILALKAVDSEADRDEKGDDVGVESERPCP
ncbi:hypothetical protein NPX13_g10773 [Xylaria arbuscula]|uniref:Uncharacterized protein n=1 Tax=Xylaria arbuscula TaxID=114810 RepID=A0A9W8THK8_9PEZI|nr:hypothetical protein NPX13_g10773 [Xylaria arbuscula]